MEETTLIKLTPEQLAEINRFNLNEIDLLKKSNIALEQKLEEYKASAVSKIIKFNDLETEHIAIKNRLNELEKKYQSLLVSINKNYIISA